MIVKKHVANGRILLTVCDSNILGKRFEEAGMHLDLSSGFYEGKEMDENSLEPLVKVSHIINAVGEESVGFFIKKGIVKKEDVLSVAGIPHMQIFLA